jgi:hypothetical protein
VFPGRSVFAAPPLVVLSVLSSVLLWIGIESLPVLVGGTVGSVVVESIRRKQVSKASQFGICNIEGDDHTGIALVIRLSGAHISNFTTKWLLASCLIASLVLVRITPNSTARCGGEVANCLHIQRAIVSMIYLLDFVLYRDV